MAGFVNTKMNFRVIQNMGTLPEDMLSSQEGLYIKDFIILLNTGCSARRKASCVVFFLYE